MDSKKERERLKQEYKDHYRSIRDMKNRVKQLERQNSIHKAMAEMDSSELMKKIDRAREKVQQKVAKLEARLDVAMDHLSQEYADQSDTVEFEEELEEQTLKLKSRETIRKWKEEMGKLQDEIESEARRLQTVKSVGKRTLETNKPVGPPESSKTRSKQDEKRSEKLNSSKKSTESQGGEEI